MAHRVLVTLMSQVCQNFYQDTELVFAVYRNIWYNLNMEKGITLNAIRVLFVKNYTINCVLSSMVMSRIHTIG